MFPVSGSFAGESASSNCQIDSTSMLRVVHGQVDDWSRYMNNASSVPKHKPMRYSDQHSARLPPVQVDQLQVNRSLLGHSALRMRYDYTINVDQ